MGNTFGATALASYGGFWISFAIILTPGGFRIVESLGGEKADFINSFGFFLMVRFENSLQVPDYLKTSLTDTKRLDIDRAGSFSPRYSSLSPYDPRWRFSSSSSSSISLSSSLVSLISTQTPRVHPENLLSKPVGSSVFWRPSWLGITLLLVWPIVATGTFSSHRKPCCGRNYGHLLELTCWGTRSFFVAPVAHFPWSDHGRQLRKKSARETA